MVAERAAHARKRHGACKRRRRVWALSVELSTSSPSDPLPQSCSCESCEGSSGRRPAVCPEALRCAQVFRYVRSRADFSFFLLLKLQPVSWAQGRLDWQGPLRECCGCEALSPRPGSPAPVPLPLELWLPGAAVERSALQDPRRQGGLGGGCWRLSRQQGAAGA